MKRTVLGWAAVWLFCLGAGAQPVITVQPANPAAIWGANATFGITATGAGPLTYQWQLDGTNLPNNIIQTVAGGTLFDRLAGTNINLASPAGLAVDMRGNIFIADQLANVIRKVDTNGYSTVVAGNGIANFTGDGGPATNASLFAPTAVVADTNGNLWIDDSVNGLIRMVSTNGIIRTVAGGGAFSSAVPNNSVATNAFLYYPGGLAIDASGNVYIADTEANCICKLTPGGAISTVAGNGQYGYMGDGFGSATAAEFAYPTGVAVDSAGNLYVADTGNNRIRKVAASGVNPVSTVAGSSGSGYAGDGGVATSASLLSPDWVTLDRSNYLYIADAGNNRVRKVGVSGIITTLAGNGTNGYQGDGGAATNTGLSVPVSVAVDASGNLYCTDAGDNRIRRVGTNGVIATVAGLGLVNGGPVTNATFANPNTAVPDNAGNLFIVDSYNNAIRRVDANGIITTVAGNGVPGFSGDGGAATNANLKEPKDLAEDAGGNLYIADYGNRRVRRVDTNGIITTFAGNGSFSMYSNGDGGPATNGEFSAYAVAVDTAGDVFIADGLGERIRKVGTNGIISTVAGSPYITSPIDGIAATSSGLWNPTGVAVDATGQIFIADMSNFRVRKVGTNGIIHTVAGNGSSIFAGNGSATSNNLGAPYGVAVDSHGNLFIAEDYDGGLIIKVDTNGIMHQLAGNQTLGISGNGGPGTASGISLVRNVKVDPAGNVWFTDTANAAVRVVSQVDYADLADFTVTNVTGGSLNLSNYTVVVTGAAGSVTSSVANVNLELPPVTPVFTPINGMIGFSWSGVSNLTYQLQFATNLAAPNWVNLGAPVMATNGTATATDASGADGQRFYRVQWVP